MQVTYERVHHIIERQYQAEQAFLQEFASGNYSFDQPLIKLNPYFISPLSAIILFRTPIDCEVTITVRGKEEAGDIKHTFPAAKEHVLPIYGLYGDYQNRVDIRLSTGQFASHIIMTAPLESDIQKATSIKTSRDYMMDNMMFLTAAMESKAAAYDYKGDVRWCCTLLLNFALKRMPNGNIMVGTERLSFMPYYTTGLYEMSLSGKIFKEYVSNMGGYHHDQVVMKDGNILMGTCDAYGDTVEDVVALIDKNTGEVLKKWDLKNVLPQYPIAGSGSQDAKDWFHNNSIWYDENTNSIILSGRHQDAVVSIDFETGKLNWILGDSATWPEEYQKYFFRPVGDLANFDWQYEQHAASVTPDGDIMLFDNGHYRSKVKENYIPNGENFSRGVRYKIDTEKMEVEQVWQYGKERGGDFFSQYICNVDYYDEGHYMIHSGGIGYKDGKVCEGFAVIDMLTPGDSVYRLNSITCEIMGSELMYELQLPANYYRAKKLPLYYAGETSLPLGKGTIIGQLPESVMTKFKIKAQEQGTTVPEQYKIKIVEEDDRIMIGGHYDEGSFAQILLQSSKETRRYEVVTKSENYEAMCVGSFQKVDKRDVDVYINKTGLEGSYSVKLLLENTNNTFEIYETGVTIEA